MGMGQFKALADINLFPEDQIVAMFKLKAIAEDNFNMAQEA